MSNTKIIRINHLPIEFWNLKCKDCQVFREGKANFIEDWNKILRLECQKLGSLRVEEWEFKIRNCQFFRP